MLMLAEFCNQSMFVHCPQQILRAPISKVKSNDPVNREKYVEQVLERYETDDILTIFRALR